MDSLNVDCLIEIVKLLSLKDQISTYGTNNNLQVAVTTLWSIKFKHLRINFLEVPLTDTEFATFLKIIEETVETLHLRFLNKQKYEILKRSRFEKVHDLRFTLSKPYFMQDSDLRDLQQVLPNLKSFSPHGNLSGLYIDKWPLLTDLNLRFCYKLEMLHFQNLLQHLELEKLTLNIFPISNECEEMNLASAQVQSLKYLELNTYELRYFVKTPLKALKELIITNFYTPGQMFDTILSAWPAQTIRLVETANIDDILVNCINKHLNVAELSIINDENALNVNVTSQLQKLSDLRTLRFINCIIKLQNFITLLKNSTQLHEISFENCQFDYEHMNVAQIFGNRVGKLRLNMFENRLTDSDRPRWRTGMEEVTYVMVDVQFGNPNLLELTHSAGKELCYEPLYILFK